MGVEKNERIVFYNAKMRIYDAIEHIRFKTISDIKKDANIGEISPYFVKRTVDELLAHGTLEKITDYIEKDRTLLGDLTGKARQKVYLYRWGVGVTETVNNLKIAAGEQCGVIVRVAKKEREILDLLNKKFPEWVDTGYFLQKLTVDFKYASLQSYLKNLAKSGKIDFKIESELRNITTRGKTFQSKRKTCFWRAKNDGI